MDKSATSEPLCLQMGTLPAISNVGGVDEMVHGGHAGTDKDKTWRA